MLRHERTVHSAEKNIACLTCNVSFPDSESLLAHCREVNHVFSEKKKKKNFKRKSKSQVGNRHYLESQAEESSSQTIVTPSVDSWLDTTTQRSRPTEPFVPPDVNLFHNVSSQNPPIYGSYSHTNYHQTYSMPVPDPSYTMYSNPYPGYIQHNTTQRGFVPNMNQVGYQMSTSAPRPLPTRPLPLSLDMSFQQPEFETEQPFFQFERQQLLDIKSPLRLSRFEDPFESVCDGLVVHESNSINHYPPLPEHLLSYYIG
jgi:hypothetical protein